MANEKRLIDDDEFEVVRGCVNGKNRYARIPIQSCIAETMQKEGQQELNAEIILTMPHDQAIRTIDAIVQDWLYWLKRAGELFVLNQGLTIGTDGEAPTIDAVEVVHGRWIHKGAWHIECSECKYILAHIGEAKNYCPNCGAKMDGGNEDG